MWGVEELRDKEEILALLRHDRLYAAYAIGDLEPVLFRRSRWWAAVEELERGHRKPPRRGLRPGSSMSGGRRALILLFSGLEPPALFCMGEPAGVAAALDEVQLPGCLYFTARAEHWEVVDQRYHLRFANQMLRMSLNAKRFLPASSDSIRRVGLADLDSLQELFSFGRDGDADGFAPFQVEHGVFYGLWEGGKLVSVAGTHLVAPSFGLAALGNVFTHPAHRGRGYATSCISKVLSDLLLQRLEVVLNVAVSNEGAVSLYRRLGFEEHCRFLEGVGEARTPTPAIL